MPHAEISSYKPTSSRCIESAQHPAHARILPARASDTALRLVDTNRQFTAIQPVLSNHQNGSIVWIEELASITAYVVALKGGTSRALRADVHLPHKSSTGPELNLC